MILKELELDGVLNEEISKFYSGYGETGNDFKAREMIITLNRLTNLTKHELNNYFTEQEALMCAAVASGWGGSSPKEHLCGNIKDMEACAKETFKADPEILADKIMGLSEFQAYCVVQMSLELFDDDSKRIKEIFTIQ